MMKLIITYCFLTIWTISVHSEDHYKKLKGVKNLEEAVLIVSPRVDKSLSPKLLKSWLDQCQKELLSFTWGGRTFKQLSTVNKLNALGSYLVADKKLRYKDRTSSEPYLLSHHLKTGEGKSFGLFLLFRLSIHRCFRHRSRFKSFSNNNVADTATVASYAR